MMNVFYLHHSGFVVELNDKNLIFDPISSIATKFVRKNTIFLISHAHGDHYDRKIWNFDKPGVYYVLSDDIRPGRSGDNIYMVAPYETLDVIGATIKTFGSTDQGVSFLIETENELIFFAGDLNWWAWDPKSRPHINPKVEESDYKTEIERLKKALGGRKLDLAFVPVDPRLDLPGGKLWAAEYFIKELAPKKLVPMHFWGDFEVIDDLIAALGKDSPTEIGKIDERNQNVIF